MTLRTRIGPYVSSSVYDKIYTGTFNMQFLGKIESISEPVERSVFDPVHNSIFLNTFWSLRYLVESYDFRK